MAKSTKQNPIKLTSYEQLKELTSKDVVECICQKCGNIHTSIVATKRKRTQETYTLCKSCLTKVTCQQKYGVENVGQLEKTRAICRNRDKSWYDKRNIKTKQTNLNRYGTEHPQQLLEFKNKQKQTMIEKYGIDNIFKNKEYIKECCQKKFGRDNYFSGEEGKRVAEEACFKKHGVTKALCKEEFKQKYRQTSLERYGVENYASTEEHTQKMQETNFKNFGTVHAPSYNYVYDGISFDSSWELAYWIYCKDNNIPIEREPVSLTYEYNNKTSCYVPDFRINGQELIEIKGCYFLNEDGDLIDIFNTGNKNKVKAKNLCMKDNNVRLITSPEIYKYINYVENTYGKNYLKSFRK